MKGRLARSVVEFSVKRGMLYKLPVLLLVLVLVGCRSLLPSSKEESMATWHSYEAVKEAYDKIEIGHAITDLEAVGFNVARASNLQILNYLEVAAKVQGIPFQQLDPGLQECLMARDSCRAYVYEFKRQKSKRIGNFWADFFNFRRETETTGWRFNAMIVLIDDWVVYKLWSGLPALETAREERNPLGPLQGAGDKVLSVVP